MNNFLCLPIILLLFLTCGCRVFDSQQEGLSHVVICWLKDDSQKSKSDFIESVKGLHSIPTVIDVSVGAIEVSSEPVADNSFDVAFIITFHSKADLESYLTHPNHIQLVKAALKPALKKVQVYDFKHN